MPPRAGPRMTRPETVTPSARRTASPSRRVVVLVSGASLPPCRRCPGFSAIPPSSAAAAGSTTIVSPGALAASSASVDANGAAALPFPPAGAPARTWRTAASAGGAAAAAQAVRTAASALRRGRGALRGGQDLRVLLGIAERAERGIDAGQPDLAGDQRPRVDLALGEHVQRVAELQRRVADDEAQVDLLVDRHRRLEAILADAHADDDHAREQRR